MYAEGPRFLWIDRDSHRTLPRVLGLLDNLHIGACNLAYVHTAADEQVHVQSVRPLGITPGWHHQQGARNVTHAARAHVPGCALSVRSEEHTSELQSLRHLVCRLLLEK